MSLLLPPCRRCKSISTPHPHPSFEIVEWIKCWTENLSNVDSSFTSVKLEMFRNLEDIISDVVWFMSEISISVQTDESNKSVSEVMITLCQKSLSLKREERAIVRFMLSCTFSDFPEMLIFLLKAPPGNNA